MFSHKNYEMKKLLYLSLFVSSSCFCQTYTVESECDFIVITKDSSVIQNLGINYISSSPCFDTNLGQSTMYWFRIEDKAYIRKKIGTNTL